MPTRLVLNPATVTNLGCLYESGVDLYYNDGNGNAVRITSGGAVNASSASGANPSASVGLSAVNGSAGTFLRSDGAPALSQSIVPTWSGLHTFQVFPVTPSSAPTTDYQVSNKKYVDDSGTAKLAIAAGANYRLTASDGSANRGNAAAITASRALISDSNGIPTHATTTSTEIDYVSGVTSAIQTQLNTKLSTQTNKFIGILEWTPGSATTTSGTYADLTVDASITIATTGSHLLILIVTGVFTTTAGASPGYGLSIGGAASIDLPLSSSISFPGAACRTTHVIPHTLSLTAGTQNFKIQWKRVAGTGTLTTNSTGETLRMLIYQLVAS